MPIEIHEFGRAADGHTITRYVCSNGPCSIELIDYGAHLIAVNVPDRDGKVENITLGFRSAAGYLQRHPYFGSTVGRFCNRIGNAKFSLNGKEYELAANDQPHHLHGGKHGFDRFLWSTEQIDSDGAVGIRFSRTSSDGEENFPGTVNVSVTYLLTDQNELKMEYEATTDQATPINLTNHCYWNLAGANAGKIVDHVLTVQANKYVAVDDSLIPTGGYADVAGSPLDFTNPIAIGERIEQIDADPVGYDHCYVLNNQDGSLALAAKVVDPKTGRAMEVLTTQPGIQLYTGNFLDGSEECGGFGQHTAFCLETQHYPDSPNQQNFPSTILEPGKTFRQTTVHRFFTE